MKTYRAKKKAELGDDWLMQERQRVKRYYKCTKDLNRAEKQQRREKVRLSVQRHRQKRKVSGSDKVETQGSFKIKEEEHSIF